MSSKSGIVGVLYRCNGDETDTFSDEAATLQADLRTVIIDTDTYKSFVHDKDLFTIKKDGGEITADYNLYVDRVIFREEQAAGTWTISGTYQELEQVGGCYDWSIDIKHDPQDDTEFTDTWEQLVAGILSWNASAKRHWIDDEFFTKDPIMLKLFWDIDNYKSWLGIAKITDIKDGHNVKGITDGEIAFKGIGLLIQADWANPTIP